MDKNSIFTGLVIGAIVPVLGYLVVNQIFELFTQMGWMEPTVGGGISRRERTLMVIGLWFSLIPFNWAKNNRYDDTMRGIVFPTLIYVGYWLYTYAHILF